MIPFAKPYITGEDIRLATEAMKSGWLSGGEYIERFERELGGTLSTDVLTTSNGTSAINLALLVLKSLKPDKTEVLVPGFCFQAVANVALQLGLTPVFYDVTFDTMQADIYSIEKKITNKTLVIALVYNYGYIPERLHDIINLADSYNLFVLEDCAEAIFSSADGQFLGTFGDIGTFSLHATKTLTTGEGGFIAINNTDERLKKNAELYRSHGLQFRGDYYHSLPGNNFRMTNFQAAFGCGQLKSLDYIISKKIALEKFYWKNINNELATYYNPILWSYPFVVDTNYINRNKMITEMNKLFNIETRPGFVSADRINYFKTSIRDIPVSAHLSHSTIVLPMYIDMTKEEQEMVCNAVKASIF